MFKNHFFSLSETKVIKAHTRIDDVLMTIKINILEAISLLCTRASLVIHQKMRNKHHKICFDVFYGSI